VLADADPYVCLFEHCSTGDQLFSHSSAWLDHMRTHCTQWWCRSKTHDDEYVAPTKTDYLQHMKSQHPGKFTEAQLEILANRNGRPATPLFSSCPLCGMIDKDVGGEMEEHIIYHLRFWALRSLPVTYDLGLGSGSHARSSGFDVDNPKTRSTIRSLFDEHSPLAFEDNGPRDRSGSPESHEPRLAYESGTDAYNTDGDGGLGPEIVGLWPDGTYSFEDASDLRNTGEQSRQGQTSTAESKYDFAPAALEPSDNVDLRYTVRPARDFVPGLVRGNNYLQQLIEWVLNE